MSLNVSPSNVYSFLPPLAASRRREESAQSSRYPVMPMTRLLRAGSNAIDPHAAVSELHRQIGGPDIAFALIFCAPNYDRTQIAAAIRGYFGDTPVFGCTTAGEITPF